VIVKALHPFRASPSIRVWLGSQVSGTFKIRPSNSSGSSLLKSWQWRSIF